MTTPLDDRLQFCRELARRAGAPAHTGLGTAPASLKGRHDVLTATDAQVDFIRPTLAERFPGEAVLGEEDGASGSLDAGGCIRIVDPVDATAGQPGPWQRALLRLGSPGGHTSEFFAGRGLSEGIALDATNAALHAGMWRVVGIE